MAARGSAPQRSRPCEGPGHIPPREFRSANGRWATTPAELKASQIKVEGMTFQPKVYIAGDTYRIVAPGFDGTSWAIDNYGHIAQGR